MDIYDYFIALFLGIILLVWVIRIRYMNLVGMLLKIMPKKIVPPDTVYEIEENNEFMKSKRFREHKKKWIKKENLSILIYVVITSVTALLFKNFALSFLGSLFITGMCLFRISYPEAQERNQLMGKWKWLKMTGQQTEDD